MTGKPRGRLFPHSLLLPLAPFLVASAWGDEVGQCRFETHDLAFRGTPRQQAECLLRRVRKWGKVDASPAVLPSPLPELVGQQALSLRHPLRKHLADQGVAETEVGGSLEAGVSHARNGDPSAPVARYFVIHDTSSPWLGDAAGFPPDDSSQLNDLTGFSTPNAVAHVFVNRIGRTLLGHDFAVPWRATKLETQTVGIPAKGLFLHVELLQPRRRDPAGGAKNDAIAPTPGFTAPQYDKLAMLYAAASARSGAWLIPAFHAAIDEGLSDAHDDPQNFDLGLFAQALATLRGRLGPAAVPQPPSR